MDKLNLTDLSNTSLASNDQLQVYNALDCLVTKEVWDKISQQLDPETTGRIYQFERALQGPTMEMTLRGILIDTNTRLSWINDLQQKINRLEKIINA